MGAAVSKILQEKIKTRSRQNFSISTSQDSAYGHLVPSKLLILQSDTLGGEGRQSDSLIVWRYERTVIMDYNHLPEVHGPR
jgi:hypothetical protein